MSCSDLPGLYARLDELMDMARDSLEVKRTVIQQHIDNGLYPYTKRYLGTLRNHFSTIGVNGMHEMLRNLTGDREGMHTEAGRQLQEQGVQRFVVQPARDGHTLMPDLGPQTQPAGLPELWNELAVLFEHFSLRHSFDCRPVLCH